MNHSTYTPFDSLCRLKYLQNICTSGTNKFDGLLFIGGVDGKFNVGSSRCFNYIFGGCSGSELRNTNTIHYEWDEIILLVTPKGAKLYCTPPSWNQIMKYVSIWDEVEVFCPDVHHFSNDVDFVEDHKVLSFLSMIRGCGSIGIPLTKSDQFEVEMWPIVQAFALEELADETRGGDGQGTAFFTMKHEVEDISNELLRVCYSNVDTQTLRVMWESSINKLRYQWEEAWLAFGNADVTSLLLTTPSSFSEPLRTYFEYGKLSGVNSEPPKVCFGSSDEKTLDEMLEYETLPIVCSVCDPRWPVRFSRSCIMGLGRLPDELEEGLEENDQTKLILDEEVEKKKGEYNGSTGRILGLLYKTIVEVLHESAKEMLSIMCRREKSEVFDNNSVVVEMIKKYAVDSVGKFLRQDGSLRLFYDNVDEYLDITLEHEDVGVYVDEKSSFSDVNNQRVVYFELALKVPLKNICREDDEKLWTLRYGETFMFNIIPNKLDLSTLWCVTEEAFPVYQFFSSPKTAEKLVSYNIHRMAFEKKDFPVVHSVLGKSIGDVYSNVSVFFGRMRNMSVIQGKLLFFEKGFAFEDPQMGCFLFCLQKHANKVEFLDVSGMQTDDLSYVIVELSPSFTPYGVIPTLTDINMMAIALPPRSSSKRTFARDVLQRWKLVCEVTKTLFNNTDSLPSSLHFAQELLESRLFSAQKQLPLDGSFRLLRPFVDCFESSSSNYNKIFSQFYLSSESSEFLKDYGIRENIELEGKGHSLEDIKMDALSRWNEVKEDTVSKVTPIVVVSGIPGSGKHEVCLNLKKRVTDKELFVLDWVVEDGISPNKQRLYSKMISLLDNVKDYRTRNDEKEPMIVLICPGGSDLRQFLLSIIHCPLAAIRNRVRIVSVVGCVSATNLHLRGSPNRTMPLLQSSIAPGYVSCIALESSGVGGKEIGKVKDVIRFFNEHAVFVDGEWNESELSVLFEKSFYSSSMCALRSRYDPRWDVENSSKPCYNYRSVFVETGSEFNESRLVNELRSLMLEESWNNPGKELVLCSIVDEYLDGSKDNEKKREDQRHRAIVRVYGKVRIHSDVDGKTKNYELNASRYGCDVKLSRNEATLESELSQFLFVWIDGPSNLTETQVFADEESLRRTLRSCLPLQFERKELRTKDSLTESELDAIRAEHLADQLPLGYFFNGVNFVDYEGGSSRFHPNMDEFIDQYLASVNTQIVEHNKSVSNTSDL